MFYLFTLRLVPVFPFFLVNLLMGFTQISTWNFFWISQLGMLPATAAYVLAGTELQEITSLNDLLKPSFWLTLTLLGLLPVLLNSLLKYYKTKKFLKRYKKPKVFNYNFIVIGGGSAGLVSSLIGSTLKAKVALIEKHKMGGDCLNTGCVPSKAFIKSAKVASLVKKSQDFGISAELKQVDFHQVMGRVQGIIRKIEPHDSVERYTGLGVDCFKGRAFIRSPYEVEVQGQILTAKNLVLATGARPYIPDLPGLNLVNALTSDSVWQLQTLPNRLVVLGGGPIGCELAQSFARLGSRVLLIELKDRILSQEDPEVSSLLQHHLEAEGVEILTKFKALEVLVKENSQKFLRCQSGAIEKLLEFDEIVLALGRVANVEGFGLEELQLELTPAKTLAVNEYMQTTNYPNIFVCGDVAGPFQFTHMAAHQAWYAAINALMKPFKKFKVDNRVVPRCTFTDPEIARVGLNEVEACAQKIPFRVSRYEFSGFDRAVTESENHGFVKVLTPPNSDKILGVTTVGPRAGDTLAEFVLAMKYNIGLNKILSTIHAYPTYAEGNKFAAGVWKKSTAPQWALRLSEKFMSWRRRS